MRPTNSVPARTSSTEIVPIEQATVHTDVLTEQQSLWGTVSHEEITINDDAQATQLE